jgi:hypothetical protein
MMECVEQAHAVGVGHGVFTVRRAFAKGRLKPYPKTVRSRRRVPLRARVVAALEEVPRRHGILFPASEGGRTNGMSIFTLARRMGTSVQMIDATYGHLARDAEDQDRDLLDAYDAANGHVVGTEWAADAATTGLGDDKRPADARLSEGRAREDSNL